MVSKDKLVEVVVSLPEKVTLLPPFPLETYLFLLDPLAVLVELLTEFESAPVFDGVFIRLDFGLLKLPLFWESLLPITSFSELFSFSTSE